MGTSFKWALFFGAPGTNIHSDINLILVRKGAESAPPSTFLCLAQNPLYLTNRRVSTFPIYLLGLRICKKKSFWIWGVCAPGSRSNAKI